MDSLSEAQFIMLAQQIKAVEKEMQFGVKRLNWNSLGMMHAEAQMFVLSDLYTLKVWWNECCL